MLQLERSALSDLGVFVDGDNQEIKWSHIQNLQEFQEQEGLTFGNKLSKSNIYYFREQALKVKYLLLSGTSSQSQIFIAFGNKLSKSNIYFHRQKIKVKIAAQTLSSSVA